MYQPGLGVDLRRLRQKTGMSTRSVATKLGISHSSVARTELGDRATSPDEVIALCALYGVTGRQRERLIERARGDASNKAWFSAGSGATEQVASLVELEMEAATITDVALTLIPGLVQVPEYAREIIGLGRLPSHETEWLVRTRISRQSLLSQPRAPHMHFFLDETVLHRPVGGVRVMREQLDHLLRVSQRENVTLRVIPLSAGAHPAVDGTFILFNFPEREPHVYIESRRGGLFLCAQEQVQPYVDAIDDLELVALNVAESAERISEVKGTMTDDSLAQEQS